MAVVTIRPARRTSSARARAARARTGAATNARGAAAGHGPRRRSVAMRRRVEVASARASPAGGPRGAGLRCPPCSLPTTGDDWLALTADELPVGEAYDWAVLPVVRSRRAVQRDGPRPRRGSRRRRAPDVRGLRRGGRAADGGDRRRGPQRWPMIGRLALLHRTGRLELGESSVRRRRVDAAPGRGVRGRALRHRRAEGVGPDLEARDLARGQRVGHGRHTDQRAGTVV